MTIREWTWIKFSRLARSEDECLVERKDGPDQKLKVAFNDAVCNYLSSIIKGITVHIIGDGIHVATIYHEVR